VRRRWKPWSDLAILGAAAAALWIARLLGWLEGVPPGALAAVTGCWLVVGLARSYLVRKGIDLEGDFRPDRWEKVGQRAIIACLAVAFAGLLVAISQVPFRRPVGIYAWAAWLGTVCAFAAAAFAVLLLAYSLWRRWWLRRLR
jgi:hypothetical protein